MADELTPEHPAGDEVVIDARLSALLAEPEMWDDPDPDAEASIVAAIAAAAATEHTGPARTPDAGGADEAEASKNVVAISAVRRWIAPFLAGAAAVLLVVAAVAIVPGGDADVVAVAMAGTPEAPDASATADVAATPLGTRIEFDVTGLPPAPEGSYYEAWLRQSPEVGVSAGTFHLRGGDGEIELWAGVGLDEYPLVTVTLQREGDGAESSGVVVLSGRAD